MKNHVAGLKTVAALAVGLVMAMLANGAHASLVADYNFNGDLTSSVPGAPNLVLAGSGAPSALFTTDTVNGSSDGVWGFPVNSGLQLNTTGLIPVSNDTYSVAFLFKFDELTINFFSVLDFKNRAADPHLYLSLFHLKLDPIPVPASPPPFVFDSNYHTVVFTRDAGGQVSFYVDGQADGTVNDLSTGYSVISTPNNLLTFFLDDTASPDVSGAGAVARIQLYDTTLTAAEAESLNLTPEPCTAVLLLPAAGLALIRRRRVA